MKYTLINISLLFLSCSFLSREKKIHDLLNSDNKTNIIKACNLMSNISDTLFVPKLLETPYDSRVSHHKKYYGVSVYQAKMNALKRISNQSPPNTINYKVDTTNVKFYLKWAAKNNYMN